MESPHNPQKNLKCSTWIQSQKLQNDLCSFPRQIIQYYGNLSQCPTIDLTSNPEEAEVEQFHEDLQDLLELTPKKKKKRCPFHHRGLECKSRKSIDTWSNKQVWP